MALVALKDTVDVDGEIYDIEIELTPKGGYVVRAPKEGCTAEGKDIGDALWGIRDAIRKLRDPDKAH